MPEVPELRARGGLPAWKKALFSLIVFLLFFGGLELVLLAVGVEPTTGGLGSTLAGCCKLRGTGRQPGNSSSKR